ncbi:MAG: YqaA family protein [Terriglobales bacterium]
MRAAFVLAINVMSWVHRFGIAGLLLIGIVDNSFVPIPGGLDIATILLVSSRPAWWIIYGAASTASAVIGGYLTYRLAKKGGKETLEKKVGKERAEKVYKKFEKHGFATVVIGSIMPPPFPIVPVLMAPGVMEYPTRKFLVALTVGRGIRYMAVAFLGHIYGKAIIGVIHKYHEPMLYTIIALAVLGSIGALLYFKYYRPKRRREEKERGEPVEELPIPGRGNQKLKEQQEGKTDDSDTGQGGGDKKKTA